MNPSDGKMISNGSYAINNINYTFDNSGVCLNEASAIDGGSAGSVYSPPDRNLQELRKRGVGFKAETGKS